MRRPRACGQGEVQLAASCAEVAELVAADEFTVDFQIAHERNQPALETRVDRERERACLVAGDVDADQCRADARGRVVLAAVGGEQGGFDAAFAPLRRRGMPMSGFMVGVLMGLRPWASWSVPVAKVWRPLDRAGLLGGRVPGGFSTMDSCSTGRCVEAALAGRAASA